MVDNQSAALAVIAGFVVAINICLGLALGYLSKIADRLGNLIILLQ